MKVFIGAAIGLFWPFLWCLKSFITEADTFGELIAEGSLAGTLIILLVIVSKLGVKHD